MASTTLNKMSHKLFLLLALMAFGSIGWLHAQVTIGTGSTPVAGSLLQLKQDDAANANSKKGLGMPRVNLTNKTALYPMFETVVGSGLANVVYNDAIKKAAQDAKHAGLMVYNLTNGGDFCPGLYVWDSEQWQKIGEECFALDIDNLYFDLPSGRDLRPLTAKTSIVSWMPSSATTTWVNSASGSFTAVPFAGTAIYPTNTLSSSPATLTFLPDAMTPAEVAGSNAFKTKESKIDVTLATGTKTETKTITINQTNKALLVNGSTAPSQIVHTVDGTNQSIAITSNAKWKMSMTASTAVTNLNPLVGSVNGTEQTDGNGVSPTQKYDIATGAFKSHYTTLTFADNESTKRFNDVSITIAQCSGTSDPTMAEWKAALVAANGGTLAINTPGNNGVAWHQDHEGNIFFSMNYDSTNPKGNTNRWMTTNLATTTYATGATAPTNSYNLGHSPTTACWGYPNQPNTATAGLSTEYDARQRLGLLYTYTAATGGQNENPVPIDQGNTPHTGVQGICPNGWHLPTDLEWTQLENEIVANTARYSSTPNIATGALPNTTAWRGTLHGDAMKDTCEQPTVGNGKSHSPLSGGFSALIAGVAFNGSSDNFGSLGLFWSSSSGASNSGYNHSAWYRSIYISFSTVNRFYGYRGIMMSVRCKKD